MSRAASPFLSRRPSGGRAYGLQAARAVGPLDARGVPTARGTAEALACDPGTGAPSCYGDRAVLKTHRRPPPAPWGWEAGEGARQADAAWWREMGQRLGEGALELDVDAVLPARSGDV